MAEEFTPPELGKSQKLDLGGDDAMELFQTWNDRNGRFTLDQIIRLVWEDRGLPMYRGVPRMMPFELKIDKVLWDYQNFTVTVEYHFSDRRS